jgi:hypothetical protein
LVFFPVIYLLTVFHFTISSSHLPNNPNNPNFTHILHVKFFIRSSLFDLLNNFPIQRTAASPSTHPDSTTLYIDNLHYIFIHPGIVYRST